jgi:hypothetical protein
VRSCGSQQSGNKEHGICCEEVKSPVVPMLSTGQVHHCDHRLDMMIMITVVIHIFVVMLQLARTSSTSMRRVNEITSGSCTTSQNNFSTSILRARKCWGYFIQSSILLIHPNVPARTTFAPPPALMIAAA